MSNLRWIYTAITRSSSKLKVCNPIHQKLLNPIKMSHNDLFIIDNDDFEKSEPVNSDKKKLEENIFNLPIFNNISEISKNIYSLMHPYLPENLILDKIEDKPYQTNFSVNFENNRFKIIIKDSGCGIAKKDLLLVFDPFFSLKDQHSGLGLPIARRIIERHKGEIKITSQEGQGSEVTIELPTGNPAQTA